MNWDKISAELNKPLDPKNVKPAKTYGPKGDYIESWLAISEANRIFGHDGWEIAVAALNCVMERERPVGPKKLPGWGVTYTAHVRLRVGDTVTREDVGAGHGYDVDVGLAHESAIKEAVSDAGKRVLRTFGWPFGLALYDKNKAHVGGPMADEPSLQNEPEPGGPTPLSVEGESLILIDGALSYVSLTTVTNQQIEKLHREAGVDYSPKVKARYAERKRELAKTDPQAPSQNEGQAA